MIQEGVEVPTRGMLALGRLFLAIEKTPEQGNSHYDPQIYVGLKHLRSQLPAALFRVLRSNPELEDISNGRVRKLQITKEDTAHIGNILNAYNGSIPVKDREYLSELVKDIRTLY